MKTITAHTHTQPVNNDNNNKILITVCVCVSWCVSWQTIWIFDVYGLRSLANSKCQPFVVHAPLITVIQFQLD